MKEISVIITTYMHGKYIRAAIESALTQTYKDYELIIINDGSPDNTDEEILKVKDPRIKYIRQKPSGLPANSRNRGIEIATGRLIAFFDGDDIWYPNKLQRCLEIFDRNKGIDLLYHDIDLMKTEDEKVFKRKAFSSFEGDVYTQLILKGNPFCPSVTVMKRSIFSEDGFSFSEDRCLFTVEDYDLWLRLARPSRYNFYHLSETLAKHRFSEHCASLAYMDKHASNLLYLLDENLKNFDFCTHRPRDIIKKRKSRIMFGAALAFNYQEKFGESMNWSLRGIKEHYLFLENYAAFLASLCRINLRRV